MSQESMVQVVAAVVFAATVLVTVLALVHLFSYFRPERADKLLHRDADGTQLVPPPARRLPRGLAISHLRALICVEHAPAAVHQDSRAPSVEQRAYARRLAPLCPVTRNQKEGVGQQLPHPPSGLRSGSPDYGPGVRIVAAHSSKLRDQTGSDLEERGVRDPLKDPGGRVGGRHEDEDASAPTLAPRLLKERRHRVRSHVGVDGDAGGAVEGEVRLGVGGGNAIYVPALHVRYGRQA